MLVRTSNNISNIKTRFVIMVWKSRSVKVCASYHDFLMSGDLEKSYIVQRVAKRVLRCFRSRKASLFADRFLDATLPIAPHLHVCVCRCHVRRMLRKRSGNVIFRSARVWWYMINDNALITLVSRPHHF